MKGLRQIGLSATEAAETVRRAIVLANEARHAAKAGGPAVGQEGEEDTGEKEVSDEGTREISEAIGEEKEHSRRKKVGRRGRGRKCLIASLREHRLRRERVVLLHVSSVW